MTSGINDWNIVICNAPKESATFWRKSLFHYFKNYVLASLLVQQKASKGQAAQSLTMNDKQLFCKEVWKIQNEEYLHLCEQIASQAE